MYNVAQTISTRCARAHNKVHTFKDAQRFQVLVMPRALRTESSQLVAARSHIGKD